MPPATLATVSPSVAPKLCLKKAAISSSVFPAARARAISLLRYAS